MKYILATFPLLAIPFILALVQVLDVFKWANSEEDFIFIMAICIIVAMGMEIFKSALYAPKGLYIWIDFIMSLILLISVMLYLVLDNIGPFHRSFVLVLIACVIDLAVGFIVTVITARRDFSSGS